MSFYLGHPKVSKMAKAFYKKLPVYEKDETKYYNDPKIEAITGDILDSVFTRNNETRPFYLYLMNRNSNLSDGSLELSEILTEYKLLSTMPQFFFRYIQDNPAEKKLYFDKWAKGISNFSDQYCDIYLKMGMDSCMTVWGNNVMALLNQEPSSVKNLARDFFKKIPIPEDVPVQNLLIGTTDNGKIFELSVGETFEVRFRECTGCASVWKIAKLDITKIELLSENDTNPSCTNCTGGNHDHHFYFKVKAKGKSVIRFTYFAEKVTVTIVTR